MSNIILKSSDITYFYKMSSKELNGTISNIREKIIMSCTSDNMDVFYNCNTFGKIWKHLYNSVNNILDTIEKTIDKSKIQEYTIRKLERGTNSILDKKTKNKTNLLASVDFGLCYYNNMKLLHIEPVEFKFNASDLTKVPQLKQEYDNNVYCPLDIPTFTQYFYDKVLNDDMMLQLDLVKPPFASFNKMVCVVPNKNKTNINEFLKKLQNKTRKGSPYYSSFHTLEENIRMDYIIKYGYLRFSPQYIKDMLYEEKKKQFILWNYNIDCNLDSSLYEDSHFKLCNVGELTESINIDKSYNKSKFIIKYKDNTNSYHMILCWKNGNGIIGPCWKLAIKKL